MAWIESHQELRNHPKLKRMARRLGITPAAAAGHLHFLWWWAIDYAPDGDLTEFDEWEIADAAGYDNDPEPFVNALIFAGFLDNTEQGTLMIHDWYDYAGKSLKQKEQARKRTQRYREKQAANLASHAAASEAEPACNESETDTSRNCDGHVTHTSRIRNGNETDTSRIGDASTGQDITGHNITIQDSTVQENIDPPLNPPEGEKTQQPDLQERRFAEFWAVYPRKVGKGAAEKAWKKIRPTAELHSAIIASVTANVERNPQWHRDNGQYIPHPSTWLNQKRWEDEIPKASQTQYGGGRNDGGRTNGDPPGFQRSTGFRRADPETGPDG